MITVAVILFALGASIGSYASVCAYRIPRGISTVAVPSTCPSCHRRLRWCELLPLASYIALRGRCLTCFAKIPPGYFVYECFGGAVAIGMFLSHGLSAGFLLATTFVLVMSLIAVIDWTHFIIPDKILLTGALLALAGKAISSDVEFTDCLMSGFLSGAILYLTRLFGNLAFGRESMGLGDVKLGALIGLSAGLHVFFASLLVAAGAGTAYGLLWCGRASISTLTPKLPVAWTGSLDDRIPFGSFLAAASGACHLFRKELLETTWIWLTSIQ